MNKINHLEGSILNIVRKHKGRNNPITCRKLEKMTGSRSRDIRRIIANLVTTERAIIASSVNYPYGYYLITRKQDAKVCLKQYYSRIREMLNRVRILNKMVKKKFGINYQEEFNFAEKRKSST